MIEQKIKISSIVKNQLPSYVRDEFPLIEEFLSQYYISLEQSGSALDLIENLDNYIKIDNLTNLIDSTLLSSDLDFFDDIIYVDSTTGFPQSYGLIQIDSEIITYTGITENSFTGCIRGFSGVTSYQNTNKLDSLVFSESEIQTHLKNSKVKNLSILFLKEFFKKIKAQLIPGFEDRNLSSNINQSLFVKQAKDFYSSKGTDQSFEILFRALYGEDVEIIKPRDYLLIPSDAQYRVTKDLVVEALEGNPEDLINTTLFQDQIGFISKSRGSITKVEKIQRGEKEYYILSLDYDYDKDINVSGSVFGNFSIHPKTKVTTSVSMGSTVLDVDSTVGFPESGTLISSYSDGTFSTISYKSKSITQFFECSGIDREIKSSQDLRLDVYAYGYNLDSNIIKVRITGVISDLKLPDINYYDPGDRIEIKSLGVGLTEYSANNWFFNIATSYNISSITLKNIVTFSYDVTTYDFHNFSLGDTATLLSSSGEEKPCKIISISNENSFVIEDQGELDLNLNYTIKKNISKVNSNNYPELNIYQANVQNVYTDFNSLYVTSSSFPNYFNQSLNINKRFATFSGSFDGEEIIIPKHGFYTGDSVSYISVDSNNKLNIKDGLYFIKKIDDNTIKLSRSKSNIYNEKYIYLSGSVTNNILEYSNFSNKNISPQKLIRKISAPINDDGSYETAPGFTGILVNGVEILNYKSDDFVFYGPIEKVDVISSGDDYDVINPPILEASDDFATGFSGYCEVEGSLERIDVINEGFDYLENPIITITGGNGIGASAKANLIDIIHSVEFNSASSNQVDLTNNTITFSNYHRFRDGDNLIYKTNGSTSIGGLIANSSYYVSIQDDYTVKLHNIYDDAILRINPIDLVSYGTGNHSFSSKNKKKVIKSISITNSGFGYRNRKTTVTSSGINTSSNTITIANNNYKSGEIIYYTPGSTPIGGISTGSYFVTKVDDNTFKLSQVGFGSTPKDFFYKNKEYIDLTSSGSGIQIFNYPKIEVKVSGKVGVSTFAQISNDAILRPIFKGQIKSVFIENGGVGYGSSEILNHNRQPTFSLNSGSGGQLKPVINNGKIVDVIILNSGSGYVSPPSIQVFGSGQSAVLIPTIINGMISGVKIISGGIGYTSSNTSLEVLSSGFGSKFHSTPKKWTVNLFERLLQNDQISDDDGVIANATNSSFGLQYSHLYSPRKLRESVFGTKIIDGKKIYTPDLVLENGKEITSTSHSPIIGWSYDGNPIYGPYGYSSLTGGNIKLMKSGYRKEPSLDRPNPLDSKGNPIYHNGFFVEDFVYKNIGDLDEYNGRFCVTPEFPNGVYAYFTTINSNSNSNSKFNRYNTPEFPYFIGNKFKSKPEIFNFTSSSNQDDIKLEETNFIRNTTPYNFLSKNSYYEYITDPTKIYKQDTEITSVTTGGVDFIEIVDGGSEYKVNDRIKFDNEDSGGFGADFVVSEVLGKNINQISIATSSVSNIEFYPTNNYFIGFSSFPHNYSNNDLVSIDYKNSATIIVNKNVLSLTTGIGSTSITGIVTYFDVSGSLSFPQIRENDIYQINDEQIKVLNIDKESSRIRVLRNFNNILGITSYSSGSFLVEKPRKLLTTFPISKSYNLKFNSEFYFDPKESVGLGTTSGVGIVSTIYFSNPGVGLTQLNIPTQSIYIKSHGLETGELLIYSSNGGNPISVSTNGSNSYQLTDNSLVYAAKINDHLIGISTVKIGIGSTGGFVGVGTTTANILYFTSIGSGQIHSFKTNYNNILTGEIEKNIVTVSTSQTHGLSVSDKIKLKIISGISTTIIIKYDDYNKRLLVNPRTFNDINISDDTILIQNHEYYNGQKVLYTSDSPSQGLTNNKIYFVVVVNSDKIRLSESYYQSIKLNPDFVNITSSTSGTISQINPPINLEKNQLVKFDLSDPSLSFTEKSINYSAFDFNLYLDKNFKHVFYSTQKSNTFEVSKSGRIGIDTNAYLELKITENIPEKLYYKLDPINSDNNTDIKKSIIIDDEFNNNNTLIITNNFLNSEYIISGIGSTFFTFNIAKKPNKTTYLPSNNRIIYSTNSKNTQGSIFSLKKVSSGKNYKKIPGISSVISNYGFGSILVPNSKSIGKVLKVNIQDIGFDYPVDPTLKPESQFPQILEIKPLSTFKTIGITSTGKNYLIAPNLIVLDGLTKKQVLDVDLKYNLGDKNITILRNTKGLNDVIPTIIPINNTNGINISYINYNPSTKDVIVSLGVSFSSYDDFPFSVGDRVLIENVSVGVNATSKGYNSSNYNYTLFTLTEIDPSIGGSNPTVTYNIGNYLNLGETPGTYDIINSLGTIIPEKYFPIFDISLVRNEFLNGEIIKSNNSSGIVNSWDKKNNYLKVSSIEDFNNNDILFGESSNSKAIITRVINLNTHYDIKSSSIVNKGWNRETGFLNNNIQRLHDNDYYQYFSYSIRSKVSYLEWNNAVSNLNHVAGFKKFGEMIIESKDDTNIGISTYQNFGDFTAISDLISVINLNCVTDFDLATEKTLNIDSKIYSDEIIFKSRILQDYIESIGNRVLIIDDISDKFNSNPRSTKFSVVDSFDLESIRSKKYIAYIRDKITNESEIILVTLIHDNENGFINQYARVDDMNDLGFFDFTIFGNQGQLLFYPNKFKVNNYDISYTTYSISDTITGIGTFNLGDTVKIVSDTKTIPQGTTAATTVVSIASSYRSSKILIQYKSTDDEYFEFDELSLIHNDSEVELINYGQLTTNSISSIGSGGIGEYSSYFSGSNINVDITPNVGLGTTYIVNSISVSIANTTSIGISTSNLNTGSLESRITSIASSTSPTSSIICDYSDNYSSAYYIVSIEDKTNNQYQMSEIVVLTKDSNSHLTEFGILNTGSNLGYFDSSVSGQKTRLLFTPIPDIDVEVRVFQNALKLTDSSVTNNIIDLNTI